MLKEYLTNWRLIFAIDQPLCKKNFWIFIGITYSINLIIILIFSFFDTEALYDDYLYYLGWIFMLSYILAGMRRMRDINKPSAYIFIPFYNFFLCLETSESNNNKNKMSKKTPELNWKMILKIIFLSFLIGVINSIWAINNSYSLGYGLYLFFALCMLGYPFIIIIGLLLINSVRTKKLTNDELLICFFLLLLITLPLTQYLIYIVTK